MAKKRFALIMSEFKAFILRGSVIDLAVGVIIGGAFNKIITSLVEDVIMPLISLIVGRGHFGSMFIALDGKHYASVEVARLSTSVISYGSFISTVLDFILMGLVIFTMVKIIMLIRGKIEKPAEAAKPEEPVTKECPFCKSLIHIDATVCPMCTRDITSSV